MEKSNRGSWGSNIGFILAAIGSAVGLGNIWGFPYKMGKCGGFTFLLVYVLLAIFVGMVIMVSELALGRKTGRGVVDAYKAVSKKYKWVGWLGMISPFLILSFYCVLGGYCIQYMCLNLADLSFNFNSLFGTGATGSASFGSMLTNPLGCCVFTFLFVALNMLIVKGGVSGGIEKFNKVGMPALFIMLVIIIIRAWTLPNAIEGLKFMFVPGYAVSAGFIESSPNLITVLGTAGGQMFFSLSLAMGIMVTYGSYLGKSENLIKNSGIIVFSDTLVALMAGLAVIPAAVSNGIANGTPYAEIKLSGPKLLFVTLQDVFASMGSTGPIFGFIFYLLVIIAAISSSISLTEVLATFFIDRVAKKGKDPAEIRTNITMWVSVAVMVEALIVAVDGLGSNGIWTPFQTTLGVATWNDCWLDFMDCWSDGIAMPLGAMLMALMIGWELNPNVVLDEVHISAGKGFDTFYRICIKVIVPVAMAFILAGQLISFFDNLPATALYIVSFGLLAVFFVFSLIKTKKNS